MTPRQWRKPRPGTLGNGDASSSDFLVKALLGLIYPSGAAEGHEGELLRHLEGQPLNNLSDLRKILASFERQLAPSPLDVRFGPGDIAEYALNDMTLYALRDDVSVSQTLLSGAEYEPHITKTLTQLCRPGMHVVDIGANIGCHSFLLSQLVGATGQVTAIEPNSENCRLIVLGILKNDVTNMRLLPVSLDKDQGWSYFGTHLGSNGGFLPIDMDTLRDGRGIVIPTVRLDDALTERIDLIKIDVEGAEARVFAGAGATLERDRPIVISEFSMEMLNRISNTPGAAYLQGFADLGYSMHLIDKQSGDTEPVSITDLANEDRDVYRIDDLLFLPPG